MAQIVYIPVTDDGEILSSSPLTILDTLYYELFYRIVGNANWTQITVASPLELFSIGSPLTNQPCIVLSPLPVATAYEYQIRRFNSNNVPSAWVSGTFTTGS